MSEEVSDHWTARVEWMRAHGVAQASWDPVRDVLTAAVLGPKPIQPSEHPETQPLTKEENEANARAEQRRIATGASSRFVPPTNLERLTNERSGSQ